MPVILGRADEEEWLDPEVHEQSILQRMFKPCPSEWLTAIEVSPLVNSAKNNGPELLKPAEPNKEGAKNITLPLFSQKD
jgi:putative SOS response-associated peptidase YedK